MAGNFYLDESLLEFASLGYELEWLAEAETKKEGEEKSGEASKEEKSFVDKLKSIPQYLRVKLPLQLLLGDFGKKLAETLEGKECKVKLDVFAVQLAKGVVGSDYKGKIEDASDEAIKNAVAKALGEALTDCKDEVKTEIKNAVAQLFEGEKGKTYTKEVKDKLKWIVKYSKYWAENRAVRISVKAAIALGAYVTIAFAMKRYANLSTKEVLNPVTVVKTFIKFMGDRNKRVYGKIALAVIAGIMVGMLAHLTISELYPAVKELFKKEKDKEQKSESYSDYYEVVGEDYFDFSDIF